MKPLLPGQLLKACEEAMSLTLKAGCGSMMRPKFHWALHYESCYQRFKCLLACWSLERKHKTARKDGAAATNTTRFDVSLLEEGTAEHISLLGKEEAFSNQAHVVQPHPVSKKLKQLLVQNNLVLEHYACFTSTAIKLKYRATIKKGDMVLYRAGGSSACPYVAAQVGNGA